MMNRDPSLSINRVGEYSTDAETKRMPSLGQPQVSADNLFGMAQRGGREQASSGRRRELSISQNVAKRVLMNQVNDYNFQADESADSKSLNLKMKSEVVSHRQDLFNKLLEADKITQ